MRLLIWLYNSFMPITPDKTKKTYFGLAALVIGVITVLFLGANFGLVYLKITPNTFNQLNNLTALFYCALTPLTFVLGVLGHVLKNDSKTYSRIALTLVIVPFLILLVQLVTALRK